MRNVIVGISVLFFTLSGIITFKALGMSDRDTRYLYVWKGMKAEGLPPEAAERLGQFATELAVNRALIEDLHTTITELEEKLSHQDKETHPKMEAGGSEKEVKVLAVFGGGSFGSGQVVIDDNTVDAVKKLIPAILASPHDRVMIEGHTDNMPIKSSAETEYRDNMELSFFRAKEIALILKKNGIPRKRISVTGYGDTRPIASNEKDEGRVKNRRVVVKLVPDDKES